MPTLHRTTHVACLVLLLVALCAAPPRAAAGHFYSTQRKHELREMARETWMHAYSSYKRVAFPADELLPLSCSRQGHDRRNPDNAAVNDVMGDYLLTVVDSLDTFPMLGDRKGFEQAVREIIEHVSFDVDSRVQVFEVTIRMMGGLLSGHLLAQPPSAPSSAQSNPRAFSSSIPGFALPWYTGELLHLAHDLGKRLLPAFQTPTGIPFARVHLQRGLRGRDGKGESGETCSAGATSLLLEFITLSRLTGDPTFEQAARKAFFAVWNRRSEIGLVGNTIDARTGGWMHGVSSTGAGIDSFFEYAAKAYILTGEEEYHRVWEESYAALQRYVRSPDGFWYRGVSMTTGQLSSVLIDSLSAFFPGVQALMGDLDGATKTHAAFAFLWKRYKGLPELFDTHKRAAANWGYPLRPEFIESNMYLYQATKDDYYLSIAEQILYDFNNRTRVDCGFAAVLNLATGELEDKMPSFVTAETLKYLYLTFDEDNPFLRDDSAFVFTTEGHPLELPPSPRAISPRNRKKRVFSPPSPSSSSSSFSSAAAAPGPTCAAHDPLYDRRYAHFLALGMERREEWEHARWLAGFEIEGEEEEGREVREGRWSETGWCAIEKGEDPVAAAHLAASALSLVQSFVFSHLRSRAAVPPPASIASFAAADVSIELLFAPSTALEVSAPSSSQLTPHSSGNGDVVVHSIAGLRFTLSPASSLAGAGAGAGYVISRVGPLKVPQGRSVVLRDKAVVGSLPEKRVERLSLWAEVAPRERPPERWEPEEEEEEEEEEHAGKGRIRRLWGRLMAPFHSGYHAEVGGYGAEGDGDLEHEEGCGCAFAADEAEGPPRELHIPALAASFGPSLVAASPSTPPSGDVEPHAARFVLDGTPLPLVLPRFEPYGCEAHPPLSPSLSSPPSPSSAAGSDLNLDPSSPIPLPSAPSAPPNPLTGHLLLLHRGVCSFARKAHLAARSGAEGVVLISAGAATDPHPDADGFVVPSADAEEEGEEVMRALVPMVLVGNSTGVRLEAMVHGAEARRAAGAAKVPIAVGGEDGAGEGEDEGSDDAVYVSVHRADNDEEEDVAGLMLGGYLVRNIRLWRGR